MTMFGVAALLAPVVGPTLGGYLTDNYNWRWIFYINLPVGTLALVACYFLLDDPAYLKAERAELLKKPFNFDYIGFGLLALTMSSWEIMLSKGQQWDWLGDPFWRVQTLLIAFVGGLILLIIREMRISNPVVNFRPLGERNFTACCIIIFCRVCRALRSEHVASCAVADAVRIRRLPFRPGAVSVWHCRDWRAPRGRSFAGPRLRCALVYWNGTDRARRSRVIGCRSRTSRSAPGRSFGPAW